MLGLILLLRYIQTNYPEMVVWLSEIETSSILKISAGVVLVYITYKTIRGRNKKVRIL